MHALIPKGEVTLNTLNLTAQMISLEAMSPSQILQALPQRLPAFIADVKAFVSNMTQARDVVIPGVIDTRKLEKEIPKFNYVVLSDVKVYVPPAVNVDWMKFLDALDQSQLIASALMVETLTPTMRWLALVLSNPQALASQRSRVAETGIVFHDIEKAKKQIAACYSKHGSSAEVAYGDVFKRNGDFLVSMKRMNDITVRAAAIDKQAVVDSVYGITGLMDKLLIRMKQNPEEYKVSGITMSDLSKLALNLGHEIEFFAAHVFLVQSAGQAMQDTKVKVEEVMSK